jgi:hypothetical protein
VRLTSAAIIIAGAKLTVLGAVMSSAALKSKLKAARVALDKKDFQSAHDTCLQILEYEPDNYFAYVPPCAAISHFDNLQ